MALIIETNDYLSYNRCTSCSTFNSKKKPLEILIQTLKKLVIFISITAIHHGLTKYSESEKFSLEHQKC